MKTMPSTSPHMALMQAQQSYKKATQSFLKAVTPDQKKQPTLSDTDLIDVQTKIAAAKLDIQSAALLIKKEDERSDSLLDMLA